MIVFSNPGLIDLDAAFTVGVNVKEGTNPIGHFGTGFNFAVATLLRDGGRITILRGDEVIEVKSAPKVIRGKDFGMVTANGRELGFTTALGKGWEPWMAFRELACNAMDEGGSYYSVMVAPEPQADTTIITVTGGGIEDAYNDRQGVLVEGPPIYADERIEIRPGVCPYIYYRGVRIGSLPKAMTHRYNLLGQIELTEDRTFKSSWDIQHKLGAALVQCTDEKLLNEVLTCGEGYLEHSLNLPTWYTPSPAFIESASALRTDLSHGASANPAAKEIAREHRLSQLGPEASVDLCSVDQAKLDASIEVLTKAGYRIADYPCTIVDDLGADRLGMAKEDRIFIARRAFERGTREVAATLLEEYAHLLTGHGDATLGLQNWLFDQVLQQIELRNGCAL